MVNNRKYGKWEVKKQIGRGSDGIIYLVHTESDANYYALKIPHENHLKFGRFAKEVNALRALDHPNVLKLIDYSLDTNNPFMVTEYCSGGTLQANIRSWPDAEKRKLYRKIISAVGYIQSMGFKKCDHKAFNVMFRDDAKFPEPVLIDFALCTKIESKLCIESDFLQLTPYYTSIWSVPPTVEELQQ